MNVRLLLVAVPLTLALAACGEQRAGTTDDTVVSAGGVAASTTPTATPSATMDQRTAGLKFAECMRDHGIDMPDPTDGNIQLRIPPGTDRKKVDEADQACRPIMESVVRDRATPSQEDFDRMVKFAQCMREQGVDVPDPKPGEGLGIRLRNGSKEQMEAAHKACQEYAPGLAKGGNVTSGGKP
ncbi:hypothetical protein [Nonomuraea jiangxiensis]|uniref:Secreted protein n=1 Tax=Nonomuraea jiangxiensis TaxID=633440 RepID=A0A1G9TPR5_9ACTN|nr:hypothetical protein [Nonomuraea jiangxiensis]SDM49528.1 hypothetical protein SAMN05421869_14551 [Nonomuraea jiangxiensis]